MSPFPENIFRTMKCHTICQKRQVGFGLVGNLLLFEVCSLRKPLVVQMHKSFALTSTLPALTCASLFSSFTPPVSIAALGGGGGEEHVPL